MMRIFVSVLMALVFWFSGAEAFARSEGIALVINDGVVTKSDVDDRMKLIMVSSGLPNNKQTREQLKPQIIGSLVDEAIRLQEAEKLEIQVGAPEIANGFAEIAKQNNFTPEQFEQVIKRSGVNVSTLKNQIKAQLAWSKVIQAKLRPQISISENDIDARLERFTASKGKSEYLLSEIFLPVEVSSEEVKIRQLAQRLSNDIRGGKASFFKVAQQFSKAAGAAQGGDAGWVQEGQLPEELDRALIAMEKGQVSAPVKSLSGYHILLVRDNRMITDETIPARNDIRQMIGLERLNRLQRRYFLDLKSAAFIENRLAAAQ